MKGRKCNGGKYKVTKVWSHGGSKWFKVVGNCRELRYRIVEEGVLEEWFFCKQPKRLGGGIKEEKMEDLSLPIEFLRIIYADYMGNEFMKRGLQ